MMKHLVALAVGGLMSVSLIAAVDAAPAGTSGKPKQQQGLQNAKKVMQSKLERDKKVREVKKKAHEKRQLAQREK